MICFPNAKINIGLHITQKRDDGYHNLETIFYPASQINDVIEIEQADEFSWVNYGEVVTNNYEDNLIFKAYLLLKKDYNIPNIKVHLHKLIPHGAGLGGGSADAAFMLTLLNDFFKLSIKKEQLLAYALTLGSDCPFFIYNTPCLATGRGELLTPINLDLSKYKICLVQPTNIKISTSQAFKNITPKKGEINLLDAVQEPVNNWENIINNDFEEGLFKEYKALKEIKNLLYQQGATYASMSGSGSCFYGIFEKEISLDIKDAHVFW